MPQHHDFCFYMGKVMEIRSGGYLRCFEGGGKVQLTNVIQY